MFQWLVGFQSGQRPARPGNDEKDQVACYLGEDVGVGVGVGDGHGDDDGKYNSDGPGDDLFLLGHSPKGSPTVKG